MFRSKDLLMVYLGSFDEVIWNRLQVLKKSIRFGY